MKYQYFCGIDVSKNSFTVAVKNERFIVENEKFKMDKAGFEKLDSILSPYKDRILVGMESTGIYHQNLFYYLSEKSYNSCVVNPYKMKQFFKFISDKPTKTDRKDAKTICKFIEFSRDQTNCLSTEEKYQVRYLVREKERISRQIARTKTDIKRILSLVFPEIENVVSIFSSGVLSILYHFPSADSIRKTPKDVFIKKCEELSAKNGRKLKISPEQIYQLACNSIAYHYPTYEKLLKMKIDHLKNLGEQKQNINTLILDMAEKLFKRQIQIAKESAIYFISEIVDINRFENHKKLIGFCGVDPVIKQSGNYKAQIKISKRGNKHARRIAFIMAGCVKRNCSYFRQYYLKKRNEGKSYTQAVIATSTKLLKTIYTLLKEDRCFI